MHSFDDFLEHIYQHGALSAIRNEDGSQSLTYRELVEYVYFIKELLETDIAPGDRVILYQLPGPLWVVHFLATVLAGGIVVTLDDRMPEALQLEIIEHVQPKMLLYIDAPALACQVSIAKQVRFDAQTGNRTSGVDRRDSTVEISFTSGTWGKPKGVVLTAGNLLSNLQSISEVYLPKRTQRVLSILPLSHVYEQMVGLLVPLYAGCEIIYQRKLDTHSLLRSFQEHRIQIMATVPRFLELVRTRLLAAAEDRGRLKHLLILVRVGRLLPMRARRRLFESIHNKFGGHLETFVVGGAPLSRETDAFFQSLGFNVYIGYGLTETSPVISASVQNQRRTGSVGKVLPGIDLTTAHDGEILVRGANVSPGYWPLDNRRAPEEWFHTGDIGFVARTGELILTGRKKHVAVFANGEKLQLEQVEHLASIFSGVTETCAVALEDEQQEPIVYLIYCGSDVDSNALLAYINRQLPIYARVRKVMRWHEPELPKTHTMKINRSKIVVEASGSDAPA